MLRISGAPNTTNTISAKTATFGDVAGGNYTNIDYEGGITYFGTAKRRLTLRPQLYAGRVGGVAKPTFVTYGANAGYSFPIYNNDDEEMFFREHIPGRWDGASDISAVFVFYLSGAEDAGDNFRFQLSWANKATASGVISNATQDVNFDQAVIAGRTAQYSIYTVTMPIDWDIVNPDILIGDHFGGRIRRVAASAPQVSNEIVMLDFYMTYTVDKVFKK